MSTNQPLTEPSDFLEHLKQHGEPFVFEPGRSIVRHRRIESFIDASNADIQYGGEYPYVIHHPNRIYMPHPECFPSRSFYYIVLLHEWYHWTGMLEGRGLYGLEFGSADYCVEEVRAIYFSYHALSAFGLPIDRREYDVAQHIRDWSCDMSKETIAKAYSEAGLMVSNVVLPFIYDSVIRADWWPSPYTDEDLAFMDISLPLVA